MRLSYLPYNNKSTATLHLEDSETFVRTITDDHTGNDAAYVVSDLDEEQGYNPPGELTAKLFTGSHDMMLALGDIVIKATRQREQLSKLLDTLPECPTLRTAITENSLILNAAREAIAKVTGEECPAGWDRV